MAKLESVSNVPGMYQFFCPGCQTYHGVWTNKEKSPCWDFNDNIDSPTVSPSLLVRHTNREGGSCICHSFIRDGRIQFLSDCTHELAGQTVELPEID